MTKGSVTYSVKFFGSLQNMSVKLIFLFLFQGSWTYPSKD